MYCIPNRINLNQLERGASVHGIALSVDVEPWWAGDLFKKDYDGHQDIVNPAVERLLEILDERGMRATFFVLGSVAEKAPGLVSRISARGHEIGSHGYSHISLHDISRDDFVRSEKMTIDMLNSICGERPVGFRAANCSVGRDTPWFHQALEDDLGYLYSSSVFPMRTPLYGYPDAPLRPYNPNGLNRSRDSRLVEFPLTVYRGTLLKMPVCGGAYLRFQPVWLVTSLLRKILLERPAVVNIHPRDIQPLEDIPGDIDPLSRFALFHGAGRTLAKLEKLLDTFSFQPLREVLCI